jgi:hypothetical protein
MRVSGTTQGDSNGVPQPTLVSATPNSPPFQEEQRLSAHTGDEGSRMIPKGNSYHTQFPDPDWHQIAERAASEKDPKKLAFLIKALCDRLEELRQSKFPEKK